jgi:hypothetical protein
LKLSSLKTDLSFTALATKEHLKLETSLLEHRQIPMTPTAEKNSLLPPQQSKGCNARTLDFRD